MKSGYWKLGTWKNIPFYMHWSVFLWLPIYWSSYHDLGWAELTLFAFLLLLLAHEAGHAVVAKLCSLRVYAIELHLFRGVCWHEPAYRERDAVLVAWGGVLGQFCVLLLALAFRYVVDHSAPRLEYALAPLFYVFIKANIVMAGINLLPVAPLDGYKAWRAGPLLWRHFLAGGGTASEAMDRVSRSGRRARLIEASRRAAAEFIDKLKKK